MSARELRLQNRKDILLESPMRWQFVSPAISVQSLGRYVHVRSETSYTEFANGLVFFWKLDDFGLRRFQWWNSGRSNPRSLYKLDIMSSKPFPVRQIWFT